METFRTRTAGDGTSLLIEFAGDHRRLGFPDVPKLLAAALGATRQAHPAFAAETMIATDRYFSYWSCGMGVYEIDDDAWACVILIPDGNLELMEDLARALTISGHFVRAKAEE